MPASRTLISLAGMLFVVGTAPAVAQSGAAQSSAAQRAMAVIGSAPQVCTLQRGTIRSGGLVNILGLEGDTLRIEQFTDPQTLAARAASATVTFAAVCNYPHRIRIESQNNGLWPTDGRRASTSPQFAFAIPYEANLQWGEVNGQLDANATVRQIANRSYDLNGPLAGELTLRIAIRPGASNVEVNAPVMAGSYGDTIRIFLEPR